MREHGSTLLYVHRNHKAHYSLGGEAQDGHLDFHTAPDGGGGGGGGEEVDYIPIETLSPPE